jgi:hypothetical protein
MAYQLFVLPDGREEIRCTSGRNTHIVRNLDGSWAVQEDEQKRIFANHGEALDLRSGDRRRLPEALPLPPNNRFGLNVEQRAAPCAPNAGQTDPEQPIEGSQHRSFPLSPEGCELQPERSVFDGNVEPEIIVCAVRWYLRFSLSYRDVEELLMERGLPADHTTI